MTLPNISPELLKAYQEEIAKRTSPATAKRKASSLRRFFSWAHKEGHIDENPLAQPSDLVITQPPEKPKLSFFKFSNILRFAGLAGLVVLVFLLAKRVQISIPWRLAPATEEELAQQIPQPTPIPQEFDTKAIIAEIREEVLENISDFSINWASFEDGNLLIGGAEVSEMALSTADTSDGDITINPDGAGIAHFLFEGTSSNFLNAQAPNLIDGSLYYGIVANNATEYDLIKLQSGSKPITRFSVDALGNTYIGQDLNVEGDISTDDTTRLTAEGELENITGYTQTEGNFTISQTAGESATIIKKNTTALSDLLVLTLDERGKPETSNSIYSTLVLNRYDGSREAMALLVDEGNAQFDGQIILGRFASDPNGFKEGSIYYNTTNNKFRFFDGTNWHDIDEGIWTDGGNITYLTSTTDDLAIGGTDSTAAFFFDVSTNTLTSPALKFDDNNLTSAVPLTVSATALDPALTQGIIDAINDAWTAATGGGGGLWTITGSVIHPTVATSDFAVGGTDSTAPFYVDDSGNTTIDGNVSLGDTSSDTITFNAIAASTLDMNTNIITKIGNAATNFDASGGLTLADNLAVNGVNNDIAGTLNLSGNTLTSSGDLTITPTGGDLILSDAVTINIGGSGSDVDYNVIGDSTTGASGNVGSDDDLYIEGNLEVDGTIYGNVSGTITPGFTEGSVVFIDSTGALAQDNPNFFWNDTDNRLGIGTTGPDSLLHVSSNTGYRTDVRISNTNTGGRSWLLRSTGPSASEGAGNFVIYDADASIARMFFDTSGNVGIGTTTPTPSSAGRRVLEIYQNGVGAEIKTNDGTVTMKMGSNTGNAFVGSISNTPLGLIVGNGEKLRIDTSGNVGIGTTDPAGALTIDATQTEAFLVRKDADGGDVFVVDTTNARVGIGTTGPQSKLEIYKAGSVTNTPANAHLLLQASGNAVYRWGQRIDTSGNLHFDSNWSATDVTTLTLQRGGNVGIGTTAPGSMLSVSGSENIVGYLYLGPTINDINADGTWSLARTADFTIRERLAGAINSRVTFQSGGNVGIGTVGPDTLLHTYGTTDTQIHIQSTDATARLRISDTADDAYVMTGSQRLILGLDGNPDSTNNVHITTGGYVGIGTTSPDAPLDVLSTGGEQLRLTYADGSTYTSFNTDTNGDLTINPTGGDVILSDAVTLNIGGSGSDVAYNVIGDSTAGASGNVGSDDDLYIEGNLEVDGTIYGNVSGTITPGFTEGSVVFIDSTGALAQDNPNFFWDDTNDKLGIGTTTLGTGALTIDNTATEAFLVRKDADGGDVFIVDTTNNQTEVYGNLELVATTTSALGNITQGGVRLLHTYGTQNTFVGISSGNHTLSGANDNTGLGYATLDVLTSGDYNMAIGTSALSALSSGSDNVAIGRAALQFLTTTGENVAIGRNSQYRISTGSGNVGVGIFTCGGAAGAGANTASYNTCIGSRAGKFILTGATGNVLIGNDAGDSITANTYGVIIGYGADASTATGVTNEIVIGYNAIGAGSNTVQLGNTSVTQVKTTGSLYSSGAGDNYFAGDVGIGTTSPNTTLELGSASGDKIIRISSDTDNNSGGDNALIQFMTNNLTTTAWTMGLADGISNDPFIIKRNIDDNPVTDINFLINSSGNVGIGTTSPSGRLHVAGTADDQQLIVQAHSTQTSNILEIQKSDNTVMLSVDVGGSIDIPTTTTSALGVISKDGTRFIHDFHHPTGDTAVPHGQNVFIGEEAGNFTMGSTATLTSHSSYNVGIGFQSLLVNRLGNNNLAIGYRSLFSNLDGNSNVAIGSSSLISNLSGNNNVGIGASTLYSNSSGFNNVAIGGGALYYNTSNYNTAIGRETLYANTSGQHQTAIGYRAGRYIADGSTANETSDYSIYIGRESKAGADNNQNEIVIGYNAIGAGSNTVQLGNTSVTQVKTTGSLYSSGAGDNYFAGDVGIGTTGPDAPLDVLSTGGEQLRLTYADGSTYTSFNTDTNGDLTIDPSGGDVIFSDGDVFIVGGHAAGGGYNVIADSGDIKDEGDISADNDLYIGGDLEVDGTIYGTVVGSVAWDDLTNPDDNLSLSMAEYTTAFTWNTAATSAVFDGFTLAITNDAVTDGGNQRLLVLANNDDALTTGTTERLLVLDNKDVNEAVTTALEILASSTGTITTAIDVSDAEIGTALAFGENDIDGTNFDVTGSTGSITTGGDIAINGGNITSTVDLDINASGGDLTVPTRATIGSSTAGVGKLTVTGAEIGKALVILDETGDQNILTASASGTPVANLTRTGDLELLSQGDLRLYDTDNTNYTGFQAADNVTGNVVYKLPQADGSASQVLSTNSTGDLTWIDISAGAGSLWTDGSTYLYPASGEVLGNSGSAGANKISGIYLADSSPLYFGTDNDINYSFSGTTLAVTTGTNDINFDANTLFIDGSADRVGIGTTNPSVELEIVGHLKADTFITDETTNHTVFIGDDAGGTGTYTTFVGEHAGQSNTETYTNAFGYAALQNNSGANSNAFGYLALQNNSGTFSNAVGSYALNTNSGDYANAVGHAALQYNTGISSNAFGKNALRYNDGDNNTAFGSLAFNTWTDDTGSAEEVDVVVFANNQFTITGHGLGATDTYLNLITTTTGTLPTGLAATAQQWKVIDANTIQCMSDSFTDVGTGTHTVTPRVIYTNSTALGYDAEPDASNQVMLGNANVTQIKTTGSLYSSGAGDNYFAGDVGIGTTGPLRELDIVGDIELSGGIYGNETDYSYITIAPTGEYHQKFYTRGVTGVAFERLRIEGGADIDNILMLNSNVGIGTTGPLDILHIVDSTDAVASIRRSSTGTGDLVGWQFGVTTATSDDVYRAGIIGERRSDGNLDLHLATATSGNIDASDARLTILSGGDVGIGTTGPGAKLHIYKTGIGTLPSLDGGTGFVMDAAGNTGNYGAITVLSGTSGIASLYLGDSDAEHRGAVRYSNADEKLYLSSAGGIRLTIDSSGKVGIGTTGPDAPLDVLSTGGEQLRLTYADSSTYTSFNTDTNGDLTITPSGGDLTIPTRVTIGSSTAGVGKLTVTGAEIGKALVILDETGDQNILTASASGTPVANLTRTGDLELLNQGDMRLYELTASGADYTGFQAPDDVTTSVVYKLPAADGSASQVLSTNSTGDLSWIDISGGAGSLWTDGSTYLYPTNRESARIYDSGGTDYIDIAHDGTDATLSFANTSLLNIDSNTLVVDVANDRVGIGTTGPTAGLHITKDVSDGTPNVAGVQIKGGGTYASIEMTGTTGAFIDFQNDIGGTDFDARIILTGDDFLQIDGANLGVGYNSGAGKLIVNGNVGIGTTDPQNILHIEDAHVTYSNLLASTNQILTTTNNQGVNIGPTIGFGGYIDDAAATQRLFGVITGRKESASSGVQSGYLSFATNNAGTMGERVRIDSSGNVGIGTDSPGGKLHIAGTTDDQQLIVQANATQTNNILEIQNSSTGVLASFTGAGNLGIGALAGDLKLRVHKLATETSGYPYTTAFSTNVNPASTSTASVYSLSGSMIVQGAQDIKTGGVAVFQAYNDNTNQLDSLAGFNIQSNNREAGNVDSAYAVRGVGSNTGAGTIGSAIGISASSYASAGTITDAIAVNVNVPYINTTGTITDGYGMKMYLNAPTGTGAVTNYYGMYIGNIAGASSSNYAIYTNAGDTLFNAGGDADTDFQVNASGVTGALFVDGTQGNVGIGETTPLAKLHIKGSADDQQLIVQANATQTNNILEIQNSGGSSLVSVDGVGKILQGITLVTPTEATVANYHVITFSAGATDITATQRVMSFVGNVVGSGGSSTASIVGLIGEVQSGQTAGTISSLTGTSLATRLTNAGNVGTAYGARVIPILSSSGNLTTWRGFESRTPITSSTGDITNAYGVYVENQNIATNLNYAIYTNAGDTLFNAGGDADTDFQVNASGVTGALFVDGTQGNVGIGTVGPEEELTVIGDIQLGITDGTRYVYFDDGDPSINPGVRFYTTTDKMQFSHDGTTWTDIGSGGSSVWSGIEAPTDNLSLTHAAYTTTMDWTVTGASDPWTMKLVNNAGSATTQRFLNIINDVTTQTTDVNTEALLRLDNADTSESGSTIVDDAILITNSGGITSGVTDAIDASATEIVNAINVGANVILGTTANIDFTKFDVDGSTGNITTAGDIAVNGGDITSTATTFNIDVGDTGTINFRDGTNTLVAISDQGTTGRLAVSDSLQVGSISTVAWSRFGTGTKNKAGVIDSNDVFISNALEVDGPIYVDWGLYSSDTGTLTLSFFGDDATLEGDLTLEAGGTIQSTANNDIIIDAGSGDVKIGSTGAGKLDVGTIDPIYTINGEKFATFMAAMIGLKEEVTGTAETSQYVPGVGYKQTIDFTTVEKGSDLWLFSKTTDLAKHINKMVVLLSASGNTRSWYEIDTVNYKLHIFTSRPTSVSYRLTAPRFDAEQWSNYSDSSSTGFVLDDNPLIIDEDGYITGMDYLAEAEIVVGETQKYNVKLKTGEIIETIDALAKLVVGNIKTGAVEAQEIATDSFHAFQGTIDRLLVTGGLVTPIIETEIISPLADSDIIIDLENTSPDSTESSFGKLLIEGVDDEVVASIDAEGNATFSGTVVADKVKTDELHARKIYADEIVSNQLTNQTTNQSITLEEIEELLRQTEQDQALLIDSSDWNINTATDSADLATIYSLQTTELYVTEQAAINSLSVSEAITVGADMVIQSTIDESSMANSINTLTAPLELQSLALAPIEMMAGMVRIDTNGDVTIEGNLYIAGKIEAEELTLRQSDEPTIDELENGFANLLSLQDFEGNEVANITASGAAQFAQITTDRLVIAGADGFLTPEISNGEITTNATAGQAIIPAGVSEIIINNPNVTDYTLVYVTPTSSTLNKVLYVKNKAPGYFIVGFNKALEIDANFNWWVIDVRQ